MSRLQIPLISELDRHYSPRTSMDEPRRASAIPELSSSARASRLQLPLLTALNQHFTPRSSMSEEQRPIASSRQTPAGSRLHLPLISDLDTYYSPRPSTEQRRPSVPEVSPKPVITKASKKQQPSFMEAMQSFPWCSGSH